MAEKEEDPFPYRVQVWREDRKENHIVLFRDEHEAREYAKEYPEKFNDDEHKAKYLGKKDAKKKDTKK